MFELIFRFFELIFRLTYIYIVYLFPVLLIISLICVFLGLFIKIGINTGFAILIILASLIAFSYIVYGGDKSFNILQNIWSKITGFFFSGYAILTNKNKNNNSNNNYNNNINENNQ